MHIYIKCILICIYIIKSVDEYTHKHIFGYEYIYLHIYLSTYIS